MSIALRKRGYSNEDDFYFEEENNIRKKSKFSQNGNKYVNNEKENKFIIQKQNSNLKKTQLTKDLEIFNEENNNFDEFLLNSDEKSKIFSKLKRNLSSSSLFYNTMILIIVNLNIAQFCFPYMVKKNGLIVVIIALLILLSFTYYIQKHFINTLIINKKSEKCNYSALVEEYLNRYCAGVIEIFSLIWFVFQCLLSLRILTQIGYYFLDYFNNHKWIPIIFCSTLIFALLLNSRKKNYLSSSIPFICVLVHILSIIVSNYFILVFCF